MSMTGRCTVNATKMGRYYLDSSFSQFNDKITWFNSLLNVGSSWDSKYNERHSSVITFRTPKFKGLSIRLGVDLTVEPHITQVDFEHQPTQIFYAICDSEVNKNEYLRLYDPSYKEDYIYDPHQIVTGEIMIPKVGVDETLRIHFDIPTDKLDGSTSYYIMLWTKGPQYGNEYIGIRQFIPSKTTIVLEYQTGVIHVDDGNGFSDYLCYIDDGTKWSMYIPHIDDGTRFNICG